MSLMSSSLLLQQRPTCIVRLIWIVLETGGWWPDSSLFVGCCFADLFRIVHTIFVQFPSSFFSIRLVSVYMVHPYSRIDTTAAWKKLHFISSDRSDFDMINNLSIAVQAITRLILMSLSVNEILLPRYLNLSTIFREMPFWVRYYLFD